MAEAIDATLRKFHASLNVSDLDRSVAFYKVLLGTEPAKIRADYAKFDLAEPPLVLSLIPGSAGSGGNLNHVGLRVRTAEELVEIQRRLEAAGMPTEREDGVECCYARQTKFWISDPDRALWEIYVFHEDIAEHGHAKVPVAATARTSTTAAPVAAAAGAWTHRLTDPIPGRIPHEDATLQVVRLEGSVNVEPTAANRAGLMADAFRALGPGATLHIHGLAADRPIASAPSLPGPAAKVTHIPVAADVVAELKSAGFVDVVVETLSSSTPFVVEGVPTRELRVVGRKPASVNGGARHRAVYLGPMAQVVDDFGNVYRRGEMVTVDARDWELLAGGSMREAFLLLGPEAPATSACCSSRPEAEAVAIRLR